MRHNVMNRPDDFFPLAFQHKQKVQTLQERNESLALVKPVYMVYIGIEYGLGIGLFYILIAHAFKAS